MARSPNGQHPAPDSILLHFQVRDTGIGIASDQQTKLFRAFSQADTSTTRKYGGTGLGLAISARLVELMGGRIWLDSKVDRGCTLHFTARFQPGHGAVTRRAATRILGLPVLVVDDNATNRLILEEMLTNWGLKPKTVADGELALDALKQAREAHNPFAVVLLDALMPGMDGFALAERISRDPGLASAVLMMLSSADRKEDAARCRELGVSAYLIKPIRQSTLLDSIMTALGPTATTESHGPDRTTWERCQRRLRVLLAEDNPVNQKLAVRLLEKRGHQVEVVGNGRAALDVLNRERFDAVLMDVQMPEMDGFEATAAIRDREKVSGTHLPIIAMTAHAMKGDRETCLRAGMDNYVSKPLRPEDLFAALEGAVPETANVTTPGTTVAAFDLTTALRRVGGDRELLKELASVCVEESPKLMEQIRTAIDERDGSKLRFAAHALKGSVGTFEASATQDAAWRMEQVGRDQNWSDASAAWIALEEAVEQLMPALSLVTTDQ